jgi:hypothetical protein
MIGPDQVVNGVTVALICLMLGFIPGLLETLTDGLENCATLFSWRFTSRFRRSRTMEPGPRWFAVAGVLLMVLTFTAYYAK